MLQVPLMGYGTALAPTLLDEGFVERTCRTKREVTSATPEIDVFLRDLLAFAYLVESKDTSSHD